MNWAPETSRNHKKILTPSHGRYQTVCQKIEKEMKTQIQAVRIYSEDIVMECAIENVQCYL